MCEKEYKVDWTRTYIRTGTEFVRAKSRYEAEMKVSEEMGDIAHGGTLHCLPDKDEVTVVD